MLFFLAHALSFSFFSPSPGADQDYQLRSLSSGRKNDVAEETLSCIVEELCDTQKTLVFNSN
jgi:hypothetical protein